MKDHPVALRAMVREEPFKSDLKAQRELVSQLKLAVKRRRLHCGVRGGLLLREVVYWIQPQRMTKRWRGILDSIKEI
jgi:hypothetical protein